MSLKDDMEREEELARRRFVHATRPKGPLTVEEAIELHKSMEGAEKQPETAPSIRPDPP